MVELPASVLSQYRYWSLYNSPYTAHDSGCAIDLYPSGARAPSPVAGRVVETRTVQAPPKPYAAEHDHLIVIDTAEGPDGPAYRTASGDQPIARLLHVDPAVEAGDEVGVGDDLGSLVRAGFFAPWVDNHIHLGFRPPDVNPRRASGSLPLSVGITVSGRAWDGTGTVVETGDTYALLDEPSLAGDGVFGVAADSGGVLDGGLPHYDGGGILGADEQDAGPVELLGTTVGHRSGRTVEWADLTVTVDGEPITGLSLFSTRVDRPGVKLICPDRSLSVGDNVMVDIHRG